MADFTLDDLRAVMRRTAALQAEPCQPPGAADPAPLTARLLAFGASLQRAVREGQEEAANEEDSGSDGSEGPPPMYSTSGDSISEQGLQQRSPQAEQHSGDLEDMPPLLPTSSSEAASGPASGAGSGSTSPRMRHDAPPSDPAAARAAALERQLAEAREVAAAEAAAARSSALVLMDRCSHLAAEVEAARNEVEVCERQLGAAEAVRRAAIDQLAEERQQWAERERQLLERRRQLEAAARHAVGVLEGRVEQLEAQLQAAVRAAARAGGNSGGAAQVRWWEGRCHLDRA